MGRLWSFNIQNHFRIVSRFRAVPKRYIFGKWFYLGLVRVVSKAIEVSVKKTLFLESKQNIKTPWNENGSKCARLLVVLRGVYLVWWISRTRFSIFFLNFWQNWWYAQIIHRPPPQHFYGPLAPPGILYAPYFACYTNLEY